MMKDASVVDIWKEPSEIISGIRDAQVHVLKSGHEWDEYHWMANDGFICLWMNLCVAVGQAVRGVPVQAHNPVSMETPTEPQITFGGLPVQRYFGNPEYACAILMRESVPVIRVCSQNPKSILA